MRREITIQKRSAGAMLPSVVEEAGEQPLLEEIFSLTRAGQNRQHGLALELKRLNRLYDRVKALEANYKALENENAGLTERVRVAEEERDRAKKLARELQLGMLQRENHIKG
jgi:hypothetical protein